MIDEVVLHQNVLMMTTTMILYSWSTRYTIQVVNDLQFKSCAEKSAVTSYVETNHTILICSLMSFLLLIVKRYWLKITWTVISTASVSMFVAVYANYHKYRIAPTTKIHINYFASPFKISIVGNFASNCAASPNSDGFK